MKFQKGHDKRRYKGGRKTGAKNKRTMVRDALSSEFDDGELGFWRAVAVQAKEGDGQAMALIANRLVPTLKSEHQSVDLPEPEGSAVDVTRSIIAAGFQGEITPDQMQVLISSIVNAIKVQESTELEERVAALEGR